MHRVFNFNPGPAMLPNEVIQSVQRELLDWQNLGMSVMEISHRSKEFLDLIEQGNHDLRYLLKIPDNYEILYLPGGATMQFASVPLNIAQAEQQAHYIVSGHWSHKAMLEAQKFCQSQSLTDTIDANRCPTQEEINDCLAQVSAQSAYIYYTPNETINGVEFSYTPNTGKIPLVADMTSSILSKPINVSDYSIIFAGMQKNIGISGLCVLIVKKNLIGKNQTNIPSLLNWQTACESNSLTNTPATFTWYVATKMIKWIIEQGGLQSLATINQQKANLLYDFIDNSSFYNNFTEQKSRSSINIPFTLSNEKLNEKFLQQATQNGLTNLKGHRVIGGMRASIYNAMPIGGVKKLIEFMNNFANNN